MRRLRTPAEGPAAAFVAAGKPPPETPWREARWCAIDLELTGLDPRKEEIIAIGAAPIETGRVLLGRSMYTLVKTTKPSHPDAVLMHKLRVADLADAPTLDEALGLLLDTLRGSVPVFHVAAVERAFLKPLFARRRVTLPAAADTELLGRLWLGAHGEPPAPGLPLSNLATALGQAANTPHHALGDALTTATVFVALAEHLDAEQPQTVGSLLGALERMRRARRFGPVGG